MSGAGVVVAWSVAGALTWCATEYQLHRFAGHGPSRLRRGLWWLGPGLVATPFWEEHTAHHRDPMYFAPAWKKGLAALVAIPLAGGLVALAAGPGGGLAFGTSYAVTYLAYESLHRRIHTHPPPNAWLRALRRHHLHHHVAPKRNHGVTSPVFDLLFGTLDRPAVVKLPRAIAPAWLLDGDASIRPEFSGDFALVGH